MIIDAHTHIGAMGKDDRNVTVADLLQSMDEAGIDMSLILANDIAVSDDWRGMSADDILTQCAGNDRIKVIGNITISRDINDQLLRLREHVEAGVVVGIKLYPGYENFYPSDERLKPVYEFCQKFNIPVVLHTGFLLQGSPGIQEQAHPNSIDKIVNLFPELIFIMAHFGNPWTAEAARVIAQHQNIYADLSGFFTEYDEHISLEEKADFYQKMKEFISITGNLKKCLFGTDWPLYSQKEYLAAVQELPMKDEERDLFFWKNSSRIFGLAA
ncbi:MAG: amidohydrolase [Candidatus Andersenbacteria bacterium]|nr:amidohydrolase [Candidatus Andersenbacteria bacterium]